MIDVRSPRWLISLVAVVTALAATLSLSQAPTPAQASGGALSSLTLTNANITLNAQPTPFLFHGTASAKDDTTNVVATFTSGTATYAVNGVSQGSLTSGVGSPATLNTGITEITVTHTDTAVTTYTIKVTRSFPITGFTVIDADDSTVLYDYPAPFNVNTVIPPLTVGHNVDRIRYRMTYADPTGAPGVTGYQTWIDNAGFCPSTCASGEWSPAFTLNVGPNTWGPLTQVTTTIDSPATRWNATITRQPAFTSSTLTNLQLTSPNITLNAQPTPYLFYGTASAKDDTTNVVATFTSGTATYAVNGVNQGSLTSGVGSPATLNTGITEITVTHTATDNTVTVYTIKIVRSFPITGFKVIDADDSTVLYDYPAPFNVNTVIPPLTVGHNVDRIRYQMTYADPTGAPGVTNTQTWIDNAGFCPSGTCASGEWSPPFTLNVGSNTWGPLTYIDTPIGYARSSWFTVITRQPAFTSSTLTNLQLSSPNITLNAQPTPFLFHGTASAKDDTTNVVATFTSGTATYAVNGVSQGSLTSGVGSPAALNTGITEITVTHTAPDTTVTTYTIKVTRSFPITGFTVIDADDSTVLYDYPAPFNVNTVIPPLTVGHNVDRIRYRMTYADPTGAPGVTGYQTWIDNAGFCPSTCASGEWSPPFTLNVGSNTWGPVTQVTTTIDSPRTSWFTVITRATAFTAIGSITVPPSGNAIPAGTQVTVTPGAVTGNPPPVVTYTWEAAPTPSDPFEPVATTVNPVWTPDNTVADQLLRVVATADNGFSTPTSITSTTFGPISGVNEAPAVSNVTISGSAVEGQVLTASARILGYPRPAVTYRWLSATDDTATFSAIPGATGSTYTLTSADVAHVVRVEVTAAGNTQGPAADDESASTARVTANSSPSPSPSPTPSATPTPTPTPTQTPTPTPGDGGGGALPGSPESVTATAVGRTLLVAWQPPTDAGTSEVSNYDVLLQPSMKRCVTTTLSCVMDVEAGRTYTVSVRALNGSGWGTWSDSVAIAIPAPEIALTASTARGRLTVTGTTAHVPAGARLDVVVSRSSARTIKAVVRPIVAADGTFSWSRKWRSPGRTTVRVGLDGSWSPVTVAQRM